ncbi:MAG TPA: zinc-ribbon and DUF3426 domain-containing protein [Methylibium sp.]|uniref:zinc-ribbon and DUF3426 domain-containing protein n=1 Tax=Methylibium sp. TaxID=2067992 RepID=UPI002DBEC7F0|nr:zinc-ribbon and DUF3426 domain-containing protein [Methylibium sp.]HEU4457930.1 zinc-ribbon and DUF3426 domain-containing protein [Methylibium sp.]
MSLATRCVHCGTIFRVVQDQLKISEGWVRCGRCQEVFSALEGLFDLEREAPPQRVEKPSATEVAAQGVADFVATHHPQPSDFSGDFPRGAEADAAAASQPPIVDESMLPPDAARDDEHIELDLERARRPLREELPAGPLANELRSEAEEDAAVAATSSFLGTDDPPAPTRWDRPRMRAGLAVGAVALVGVLLVQVALQFRDVFAAQWPESRGAIEALCEVVGCRIEPMRRLAAVSVEASGLTQVQNAEAYRLAVTLHNHSAFEVAVPSIDLSLTDGGGGLVSRRALAPSDFSASPALASVGSSRVLAPGAEVQLQALLSSRAARITGYNVELFYP